MRRPPKLGVAAGRDTFGDDDGGAGGLTDLAFHMELSGNPTPIARRPAIKKSCVVVGIQVFNMSPKADKEGDTMKFRSRLGALVVAGAMTLPLQILAGESELTVRYVTPNFQNVDLVTVARAVTEATGRVITIDPTIRKRIDLVSQERLTLDEFYRRFLRVLAAEGLSVTEREGVTQISSAGSLGTFGAQ